MNFLPDSDLFYIIVIRKDSFGLGTFGLGWKWHQPAVVGFVVNNFESAIFLACCWSFDNLHEKGVVYVVQGSNQREDDLLPFIAAVKRAACWDFDNFWFMSSSSSRCEFINCTLQWSKACFAKPCHVCIGLSHLLLLSMQVWQIYS